MGDTALSRVSSLIPARIPNDIGPEPNEALFRTAIQQAKAEQPQSPKTKSRGTKDASSEPDKTATPSEPKNGAEKAGETTDPKAKITVSADYAQGNLGKRAHRTTTTTAATTTSAAPQKFWDALLEIDKSFTTADVGRLAEQVSDPALKNILWTFQKLKSAGARGDAAAVTANLADMNVRIGEGRKSGALSASDAQSLRRIGDSTRPGCMLGQRNSTGGIIDGAVSNIRRNFVSMDEAEAGKLIADTMARPEVQSLPKSVKGELENALWDAYKTANRFPLSRDDAKRNLGALEGRIKTLDGMVKHGQLAPEALNGLKGLASEYRKEIQKAEGGPVTAAQQKANAQLYSEAQTAAAQQAMTGPSANTTDALNAVTKVLDNGAAPTALKEGLEGLKSVLELAQDGKVASVSDLSSATFKTLGGIMELLARSDVDGALEAAAVLNKMGTVLKLPSSAFGVVDNSFKALIGKDMSGKDISNEERLKALWELPGQLKDVGEFGAMFARFAPRLSTVFEGLAERMASVNPLVAGVTISYEEFKFLAENVYLPAKRMLTDSLTAQYLGGDPEQLRRDVRAIQITPENAADAAQRLQGLFKNGGIASMPNMDPVRAWQRFLSANLSAGDKQTIELINSARDRNDPSIRLLTQNVAQKLQRLAVQFIDQEIRQANGD